MPSLGSLLPSGGRRGQYNLRVLRSWRTPLRAISNTPTLAMKAQKLRSVRRERRAEDNKRCERAVVETHFFFFFLLIVSWCVAAWPIGDRLLVKQTCTYTHARCVTHYLHVYTPHSRVVTGIHWLCCVALGNSFEGREG
ncbi:hypothetical protein POVWA2_007670 [Plasmodium ovale wallikeri]|uniref:Uncharacterized protein n=1 Tax=Plasmodium ovale wallikeri TaxID=864142 RepID=A0A1A8YKN3_PLAOA|nr:hypothetical protein POVWA2_007670 [Plasmodium ovale wallikeri]